MKFEDALRMKCNHEISEEKVEGFLDGFECAQYIYQKKIKDLETKRAYWKKRFNDMREKYE